MILTLCEPAHPLQRSVGPEGPKCRKSLENVDPGASGPGTPKNRKNNVGSLWRLSGKGRKSLLKIRTFPETFFLDSGVLSRRPRGRHFRDFFGTSGPKVAISAATYRGAKLADIGNSRKTAEKGAELVTVKQPKTAFSRLLYRDPLGTLFGCFQCRAFGTSAGGRGDCDPKGPRDPLQGAGWFATHALLLHHHTFSSLFKDPCLSSFISGSDQQKSPRGPCETS